MKRGKKGEANLGMLYMLLQMKWKESATVEELIPVPRGMMLRERVEKLFPVPHRMMLRERVEELFPVSRRMMLR